MEDAFSHNQEVYGDNVVTLYKKEVFMYKKEVLNSFQKFICKIFKIKPAQYYDCVINIYTKDNRLHVNDLILVNEKNDKFLIIGIGVGNCGEKIYIARNLVLCLEEPCIKKEILFFGNALPEEHQV